ncbi:unnamed protein product [Prunus armeniaca]
MHHAPRYHSILSNLTWNQVTILRGIDLLLRIGSTCIISSHVIHGENTYPFKLPECAKPQSQPVPASTSPSSIPILVSPLPFTVEPTLSSSSSPSQHPNVPLDDVSSELRASDFALQSSDHFRASLASKLQVMSLPLGLSSDVDTGSQLVATAASPSSTTVSIPHNTHTLDEPNSYRVASSSPDWIKVMTEEIKALQMQGTWCLVPPPPNTNIVGSKWIYKIKGNADGIVSRYKARLAAHGFSQEAGFDYTETFSPVVRHTTVRIVLSVAAMKGWDLRQLDVKNAFLHGELEEEVYMRQPQGFEDPILPHYVCKLHKSLYGLKQAPRAWNSKFTGYLPALGFKASHSDPSLFVKSTEYDLVVLLLYVDNIIIIGSNEQLIQVVISDLGSVFDVKDMGKLTYFLGLQVSYPTPGAIFVNQTKYVGDLLHKAGMTTCKTCPTPCKPHTQVLSTGGEPLKDPTLYRSIVGALQYLTFTKPDIAYSVNTVFQYMTNPTEVHFYMVKRILRPFHQKIYNRLCCFPWCKSNFMAV